MKDTEIKDQEKHECEKEKHECECQTKDHKCECEKEKHECECEHEHKKDCKHHHDKKEKHEHEHKEIEELKKLVRELQDKNLRTQAELINYRNRKDEEVSRMLKYANEDIILELLPIVDSFERAIKMDDNNLEDEVSKFLYGFKMIYCQAINVLDKYGVKAIDGANKPFDPTYHQAMLTEHVDGLEAGMVVEVLQKGYLLKDKVIRPAMVKVSE